MCVWDGGICDSMTSHLWVRDSANAVTAPLTGSECAVKARVSVEGRDQHAHNGKISSLKHILIALCMG